MFQWISSNFWPLNLLLVGSHQADVIMGKRLIQGRYNMTRVRVEPKSCDQSRKNDSFSLSATLPTDLILVIKSIYHVKWYNGLAPNVKVVP